MRRILREFIMLYGPIALGILLAAAWFLNTRSSDHLERVSAAQQDILLQHKVWLDNTITEYAGDAVFLAHFLADRFSATPPDKGFLQDLLARFSISRSAYAQLRILDPQGMEYVRFNVGPAGPLPVPPEQLQDKSEREYFKKAVNTPMGAVYISDLDLNQEHGRIEADHTPMLRFATPIRTTSGLLGVVVLNLDCREMLESLRDRGSRNGPWLINSEGHWLVGPSRQDEWGLQTNGDPKTIQSRYPKAWLRMQSDRSGQFLTAKGLFTYARLDTPMDTVVRPGRRIISPPGHGLHLVSLLPPPQLKPEWHRIFQVLTGMLLLALALAIWRLSSLRLKRRETERELRESEEQLKAISVSSHDAITVIDHKGRIRFWNPAAERLFGDSEQEILGTDLHAKLAVDEDQSAITRGLEDFARTGRGKVVGAVNELQARRADGRRILLELSISSVRLDGHWHAVGVMRDITERRAAEESLRESEAAARALLNAPPDAAMLITDDGTLLALNNVAASMLGSSVDTLVGSNLFLRLPDSTGTRRQKLEEAMTTGMPTEFRDAINSRHYHGTFYPFLNISGTQRAALFVKDITRETQNRERVETLSAAVEQSSASVFITDADGVILYTNPRFTEMTGYSPAEAKGRKPDIIDTTTEGVRFFEDIWQSISQGNDWRGEVRHKTNTGLDLWALLSVSPILDETGAISHFVGVEEEITALKQSEAALRLSEQRFRDVSEAVGEFIWEVDATGRLTFITKDVETLFGFPIEDVLGKTPYDFMPEDDAREMSAWMKVLREHLSSFKDIEHRFITRDGSMRWLQASGTPFTDENGQFMGMRGASMDITERKESEDALKASEEKLRALAKAAYEAIIMIDSNGSVSFWNSSAEKLFGYTEREALGKDVHTLTAPPEYREHAMNGMYGFAFTGDGKVIGAVTEVEALRKDGTRFPAERSVASFRLGDKWYAVATIRDISERKLAEQQLKEMATTDPLTELFNRRRFMELAEQEFAKAKRYHRPLSMLMMDLDHFKHVNDSYGHDVGDVVLQSIALTASEQLRDTDIIGRIGGEEFAVILPETNSEQALEVAERIRQSIEDTPPVTPAGELKITVSIGVSSFEREMNAVKALLKQSDTALYNAKNAGRNRVRWFTETE